MKTIFLFDDSRPSDLWTTVVALGEDGQLVTAVRFDKSTAPHFLYAMGFLHELNGVEDNSVADPLNHTRTDTLRRYDAAYGRANWIPVWLPEPHMNLAWCEALRIRHERIRQDAEAAAAARQDALASLITAIFTPPGAADPTGPSIH